MNPIVEEMKAILEDKNSLAHYGIPRRSGRYPWGSGDNGYQRTQDFIGRVDELRKQNYTYTDESGKKWTGDTAIAKSLGLTSGEFRTEIALAKDERRMHDVARAKSLKSDGYNNTEIGKIMGLNESSVRSLLNPNSETRMKQAMKTADFLREQVDKKEMVDVGKGVERELGVSREKFEQSLYILQRDGYNVYGGRFDQINNPGKQTTQKVLCKPGIEHKEIYELDRIKTINDYVSRDGGESFQKKFTYPESLNSKRLQIRYNEEGGIDKDGVIELRRGVDDLSLGEKKYSQVRIMVDGTHYLKGMAVYSDNMPDGVDVIFNTNKKLGTPMEKVLKPIKNDPDNPFGAAIKDSDDGGQYWYTDKKTGQKKLGLINKHKDEGDWSEWKDTLPSQFLAKQSMPMIKKQLNLAKADKQAEFEEIMSINNPTIKKHYLQKFSDECDSAAVHLKAAALPGQKYHVILPVTSMKETEVYAPGYKDGTKLALVRYPHGGTFEIPICTVNNKNIEAKKMIGTESMDAIGINSKVAERLSGADFDGDTVMCIPTHDRGGKVKITSTDPLKDLEGYDPKFEYPERAGMKYMKNTGTQMGIISNLITDMTLAGADEKELARAVRHSMTVIDAEKHKLDYRQSEIDNNIAALHKKYQGKSAGGASTILSRAKGETSVVKRQGTPKINMKGKEWYDPSKPEGAYIYKTADDAVYPVRKYDKSSGIMTLTTTDGKKITYDVSNEKARKKYEPVKNINEKTKEVTYTNKDGSISYKTKTRTQQITKMAKVDDAYELVSKYKHPKEIVYADYANYMKSLANKARKEMMLTENLKYSATAKSTYKKEYDSLMSKLNTAELNTTRERAAQRMANAELAAKKKADPDMKKSDAKKTGQVALNKYRQEVGSVARRDRSIDITDKEWEAIQAGAISESKLKRILNNADADKLRDRATPRSTTTLSAGKINRIKAMSASNYSIAYIADALGVSTSTVSAYLKGVK